MNNFSEMIAPWVETKRSGLEKSQRFERLRGRIASVGDSASSLEKSLQEKLAEFASLEQEEQAQCLFDFAQAEEEMQKAKELSTEEVGEVVEEGEYSPEQTDAAQSDDLAKADSSTTTSGPGDEEDEEEDEDEEEEDDEEEE